MAEESVTRVARHFSDYINRVSLKGERVVLTRGGRPVAELRPVPAGKQLADLVRLLSSMPHLGREAAEGFGRDLDVARAELGRLPLQDPWER